MAAAGKEYVRKNFALQDMLKKTQELYSRK
jgi:hypothetical protein